ncbi:galactokinase [Fulvivirga sp. 29W222]|uniref:Galactokinase n=1 Tax=Fulvivirga marina TaxID=2494733 RepID=A0A937KBW8_9BACT|nr:galactokinase [Fulvivirga marina]MBL6446674.1 galactokinase [Fulvivirga marina]
MEAHEIQKAFINIYGQPDLLVRSPARINLIGEHTDYNGGYVLPAAINKETYFAISGNGTRTCNVYSTYFDETATFDLDNIQPSDKSWANYIIGAVDQIQKKGYDVQGFNIVFGGNIPIGAGLSSSASVECGLIFSVNELFSLGIDPLEIIKMGQKAENEFVGVQCGIMDQFINVMGKKDNALRLDCRSLEHYYFPLKLDDYCIMLCNSRVSHSLATSAYNTRKEECFRGVEVIKAHYPEVESLRDVKLTMLQHLLSELGEDVFNRCEFVIEENLRVLESCEQLQKGDLAGFGKNLYDSHYGLALKYKVSCPELDFLIGFTINKPQIVGARMMGGGFGGCSINIVEKAYKDEFAQAISDAYQQRFEIKPEIYEVASAAGTSELFISEHINN